MPVPMTVSRDMCALSHYGPAPTFAANVSAAHYVHYGETRLDLRSAYISFNEVYAQDGCGKQVGSRYPGAIMAMRSVDVSSISE